MIIHDRYMMIAATTKDWFQPVLWHTIDLPLRELEPEEVWKYFEDAVEGLEEPPNFTGWTWATHRHSHNPDDYPGGMGRERRTLPFGWVRQAEWRLPERS